MADWTPGLFALPCGIDYGQGVVDGLIERFRDAPPEDIARVTIYANAGSTKSALNRAFQKRAPTFLPRIRLINELGRGPTTAPLARRLELGQLVATILAAQPDLARGQSVPELSGSLAQLMTEMQLEGLGAEALDLIDASDHAQHWARSLAFLKIAADFYLTDPPQDRPALQRIEAERLAAAWAEGRDLPPDPVMVVGSTGSHGATRAFMQAVARLPNGAVVLPGFDWDQPDDVWRAIDTRSEDHPQARFAPFVAEFGRPARWTAAHQSPDEGRNRLISLALRPAPVSDQWIADGPALGDLMAATSGLTLIEADQPGEEAEAIALALRAAVENQREVALLTGDAGLIRRVTAALDRWRIVPDDSSGQPLSLTAPGLFLRHVSALFGQPLTIDTLLVMLKHPVTNTGSGAEDRREHQRHTRDLELELRKHGPAFPDAEFLRSWGARTDALRQAWAQWLADMLDRIAQVSEDRAPRPLPTRLEDVITLAEAFASGPGGSVDASILWTKKAGQALHAVVTHLRTHAHHGHAMTPGEFSDLLMSVLLPQTIRIDVTADSRIHIRGGREARTENSPLVILAGLNEGGWPRALTPDPWLSRPMRVAANLPVPERQIGLAAHDFQQGVAAPEVILTRARRDADAETIPSRWLNRLLNLLGGLPDQGGQQALAAMRHRGQTWLTLAHHLAHPAERTVPEERPSPIPPAPALSSLSVTDVRTLIRDPFSIYARRVLGLRALPPMRPEPDPAERGTILHEIVRSFLIARGDDTSPEALKAVLLAKTDEVLEREVPWPSARLFWRARIAGIADRLAADEAARLSAGSQPIIVESGGKLSVEGMEFSLTAQPDRIDLLPDGRAQIYDYKSGKPPTDKQIAHFDKQLPLEAALAERGAFDTLGQAEVAGISYIQLGGEGKTEGRDFPPGFADETWDGFVELIGKYLRGERGFTALLAMEQTGHGSDYDHLSRRGEWSTTEPAKPRKVGDHGNE